MNKRDYNNYVLYISTDPLVGVYQHYVKVILRQNNYLIH